MPDNWRDHLRPQERARLQALADADKLADHVIGSSAKERKRIADRCRMRGKRKAEEDAGNGS